MTEHLWSLYQNTYFRWPVVPFNYSHFSIISGRNPHGSLKSEGANQKLHGLFEGKLQQSKLAYTEIIAGNQDFSFVEPSFAVAHTFEEAHQLAIRLRQNAFFWVESDQLSLVPAMLDNVQTANLGTFSSRLVSN